MRWAIVITCVLSFARPAAAEDVDLAKLMRATLDQARDRLRENLKDYETEKNPSQRFLRGAVLFEVTQGGTFREYPSVKELLTPKEHDQIRAANEEYGRVVDDVRRFEASLGAADVAVITAARPSSVFRGLGKFSSRWELGECTAEKYAALKRALGTADFHADALDAHVLARAYETEAFPRYFAEAARLIREDPRFKGHAALEKTYYAALEATPDPAERAAIDQAIARAEARLKKSLRGRDVEPWVLARTILHPECLLSHGEAFLAFRARDFTRERGERWLSQAQKRKKRPGSCREAQDWVHRDAALDAWNRAYLFEWKDGACRMYSTGGDLRADADDLEIGVLKL